MNIALEKDTVIHIPIKNSLICTYAILSIFGVLLECVSQKHKQNFLQPFFFYIITALPAYLYNNNIVTSNNCYSY